MKVGTLFLFFFFLFFGKFISAVVPSMDFSLTGTFETDLQVGK